MLEDQLGLACWSSSQSNPAFHINKLFTQVVTQENSWISGFSIRCHDSTDGSISSTIHPCSERTSKMKEVLRYVWVVSANQFNWTVHNTNEKIFPSCSFLLPLLQGANCPKLGDLGCEHVSLVVPPKGRSSQNVPSKRSHRILLDYWLLVFCSLPICLLQSLYKQSYECSRIPLTPGSTDRGIALEMHNVLKHLS